MDPDAPEEEGTSSKKEYGMTVSTTVGKAGDFGRVMALLQPEYEFQIERLRKEGSINEPKAWPLIQTKISPKNKKKDKDGKELKNRPLEDPIIRGEIDFSLYPQTHPLKFLRGKPKTELLDFTKVFIDAQGKPQFKALTHLNPDTGKEEPITAANAHKVLRRGTRIVDGRFHMDYGTETNYGVASAKLFGRLVVDNRYADEGPAGETDPELDSDTLAALMKNVSVSAPAPAAAAPAAPEAVLNAPAAPTAAPAKPAAVPPPLPPGPFVATAAAPASNPTEASVDAFMENFK
jgi:hypothetical protein